MSARVEIMNFRNEEGRVFWDRQFGCTRSFFARTKKCCDLLDDYMIYNMTPSVAGEVGKRRKEVLWIRSTYTLD